MRPRSITGPLILVLIGLFFLISNLRPDLLNLARIGDYWPFLLIAAGVIGLIEVFYRAGRGMIPPPRPLGGPAIFWILVFCFFFAVMNRNRDFHFAHFDTDSVSFLGSDYGYDVNAVQPAQGIARIVLDNLRGDLSLKGSDSGEIKVTGHETVRAFNRNDADRTQSRATVRVERQGDRLLIHVDDAGGSSLSRIAADLDIAVPRGISVESRGRNGDLTVEDIDGTVDVSAGRGDIHLTRIGQDVRIDSSRGGDVRAVDVKGNVDLEGRGGDIQIENVAGPVTIKGEYSGTLEFRALASPLQFNSSHSEFHAEAVPGTISMDLGNLKMTNVSGPVRFQTGTRDIQATDVTNSLDLVVDRGDIDITATVGPLPRIDAHSHNGDIALTLPEKAGFQLNGSTALGDVENDFGAQLQTHSSGRSAEINGQTGSGPQITVATDRGNISVKKT